MSKDELGESLHCVYILVAPDESAYIGRTSYNDGERPIDGVRRRYQHNVASAAQGQWLTWHGFFERMQAWVLADRLAFKDADGIEQGLIYQLSRIMPLANIKGIAPDAKEMKNWRDIQGGGMSPEAKEFWDRRTEDYHEGKISVLHEGIKEAS